MRITFPDDFIWGISSSAYQIEGAWNIDGRGPSIWDDFCHVSGNILNNATGDIACDFYHRYKDDISLLQQLGVKSARFSISWSRIIPSGIGEINKKGIEFYIELAKECKNRGIEPVFTLFHWDLPSALMHLGGYASPSFPDWFLSYSETVMEYLSPYTDKFVTINQPYSIFKSVASTLRAPAIGNLQAAYASAFNSLLAHGKVVNMARRKFPDKKIGIVLNMIDYIPYSMEDIGCAEFQDCLVNKQFLEPLFLDGFPNQIIEDIESPELKMRMQNPALLKIISSPMDFIGINYYQSMTVKRTGENISDFEKVSMPNIKVTDGNRDISPRSLRKILDRVYGLSNGIDILITENGADYRSCGLDDETRIDYLKKHLQILSESIDDGLPVKGYYLWTLMDNFEWENGFEGKYGIFSLGNNLERIPKKSAKWYANTIKNNGFECNIL